MFKIVARKLVKIESDILKKQYNEIKNPPDFGLIFKKGDFNMYRFPEGIMFKIGETTICLHDEAAKEMIETLKAVVK